MIGVNRTLLVLTIRQMLGRRRWTLVLTLVLLPVIVAVLFRAYNHDDDPVQLLAQMVMPWTYTAVVPMVALILANATFAGEVDDGTIVYLLTTPVSRIRLAVVRVIGTAWLTSMLCGAGMLAAGLVLLHGLDSGSLVLAATAGSVLGSVLYSALFLALGLITRRGMLIGLIYFVVWEGAFSQIFAGTRALSVHQYMRTLTDSITSVQAGEAVSQVPAATAWILGAVVFFGAIALAARRLSQFEISQSA